MLTSISPSNKDNIFTFEDSTNNGDSNRYSGAETDNDNKIDNIKIIYIQKN